MHKKILRIFSLVLAFVLVFSVLPTSAKAAEQTEVDRINDQIRTMYRQTLRASGMSSLHGYCGTMVNWHLYLMGITTSVIGNDGNTEYDYYSVQKYTSGGYRVRTYSAADYSLEESLNAVTYNGTRDVYNLVVGFQRTNTTAGRRYGHTLMIHAIMDGIVYFSESFASSFNGKYYAEGAPISCTIAEFAQYYDPWTEFEGLLYFGLKTYAESCEYYPSYLYVTIEEQTPIYTAPCRPEVDDRSSQLRTMLPGERITVTGLYCNTEGEYWYQVEDCSQGYIPAASTKVLAMRYDDVVASNVDAPTVHRIGRPFDVKGKIRSTYNEITSVRAQVFSYADGGMTHVMSASTLVSGNHYSLSGTQLSNQLAFRHLEEGSYRYELAAVVANNYYADGCLQTEWKTVKLWNSDFQASQSTSGNCNVTFDANGGSTALNAMDVAVGDVLTGLPEATREGYVFDGWYTADGVAVTEGYVVERNTTLYARWTNATDMNGWHTEDGNWYYYMDGLVQTGFVSINGVMYHLNEEGYADTGLLVIDGETFYFHVNGAMHYGWLDLDGRTYYMDANGVAVTGPQRIDGMDYIFDSHGVLEIVIE